MTTISEGKKVLKLTEKRYLCPICNRNSEFEIVAVHEGSQYYLFERCPKCKKHVEDIRPCPYRLAAEHLPAKETN